MLRLNDGYGGCGYGLLKHVLPGVSEADASSDTVQLAFKFRLPCRLRFPNLTRFSIPSIESASLVILNDIELPSSTTMQATMDRFGEDETPLYSTALAIFKKPKPTAEFLKELAKGSLSRADGIKDLVGHALTGLNRVVIAHRKIANLNFGLSSFPVVESDALETKVWVVTPPKHNLTDDELRTIAQLRSMIVAAGFASYAPRIDVGDLSPETMDKIGRVFARLEEHVFDEFEFASHHFLFRGEDIISLLMAVVALEASHSAFLREYLERVNVNSDLCDQYLKDLGLFATLPITAKLFVRVENRATDAELAGCLKGITIRNSVMHALLRKGKPKVRNLKNQDIHDARCGVLAIQKRLVDELEHVLATPQPAKDQAATEAT